MIAECKHKTDKIDAQVLAEIPALDMIPEAYRPSPRMRQYRVLVRHRRWLSGRNCFRNNWRRSMYGLVASYPDAYEDICPASPVAYHALKGGIIQMTRHLAVYWAKDRIRVNCLSPGPFPSDRAPAAMVERLCTKSPLGRMGQPHELKGAVVLLASDASSYMTGQNLVIDGGWTAW